MSPIAHMSAKKSHTFVERPSATTSAPNPSEDPTSSAARRRGAQAASAAPPSSIPTLNETSLAVSFHTSSPNVRTITTAAAGAGVPKRRQRRRVERWRLANRRVQ